MNQRAPQPRRGWVVPAILAVMLAAAGCGGASSRSASTRVARSSSSSSSPPSAAQTVPTPAPTGTPATATSVQVIRNWSSALRRGDVQAAAQYFALPSTMINGPDQAGDMLLITIRDRAEAVAANAGLPCGARFISADQRGRYVNALFRLTDRPGPGGGCGGGIGQMARTNFVIRDGHIAEWIRAPDDPGDNGGAVPPSPGGSGPGTTSPAA